MYFTTDKNWNKCRACHHVLTSGRVDADSACNASAPCSLTNVWSYNKGKTNMSFSIKKYFQVLGVCLGVMLIGFFVVMGFDITGGAGITEEVDNTGTVAVEDGGTINVLLLCTDEDGLRTDAMMLASYDTQKNTVNMLSIPRDLRMYVGNRYQKINAAHAYMTDGVIGGATAACEAVTRLTGVPINYYVDFSFDAVAHVINELGPVTFEIPDIYGDGVGMVYDDPVQGLHINLPPGVHELDGTEVVHLLRYRKGNPDPVTGIYKSYPNGDADRIKVQQDFMKALVDQKLNISLIQKLPAIFTDIKNEIKTNLTVRDVLKYSKYLSGFTSAGINTETVPGTASHDSANGDVFIPDMHALKATNERLFGVYTDNMWYADPDVRDTIESKLYSSGYMTLGGYVRSTDSGVLAGYKASDVTNDELCLIRGIEFSSSSDGSSSENSADSTSESDDYDSEE